jgi:adrenodoxin-NADP+ reductase
MAICTRTLRSYFSHHRLRHLSTSPSSCMRVAIVGSGPSGFYTAKYLLKADQNAVQQTEITMIDRLPVPFGLVRFGVAPDHPEVKNVVDDFTNVASDPRFRFMGNVELSDSIHGSSSQPRVTLSELRNDFDAVVLTYGAEGDRKLNIDGENLEVSL